MGQKESGHVLGWCRHVLESDVVELLGGWTWSWEGLAGECASLHCCLTLVSGDVEVAAPTLSSSLPTAGFESLCSEVCLPFAGEGHSLILHFLQFSNTQQSGRLPSPKVRISVSNLERSLLGEAKNKMGCPAMNRLWKQSSPALVLPREEGVGGGELEPFSEAEKTGGHLGHVRGQGGCPRVHSSARTKGLGTSGSALVQSKDAGLVQFLPQGGFQGQVVVHVEDEWLLNSLEIVV